MSVEEIELLKDFIYETLPISSSNNQVLITEEYLYNGVVYTVIWYRGNIADIMIDNKSIYPDIDYTKEGWVNKYTIKRNDGEAIPAGAEFFCLRLDDLQNDKIHKEACRFALQCYSAYLKASGNHLPELIKDIDTKIKNWNNANKSNN